MISKFPKAHSRYQGFILFQDTEYRGVFAGRLTLDGGSYLEGPGT